MSDSQWLFIFMVICGFVDKRHSKSWLNRLSFCAGCNCRLKICTLIFFSKKNKWFFLLNVECLGSLFIPLITIQGPVFVQRVPDVTIAAAIKLPVCWWNKTTLFFLQPWSQIIWKLSHCVEIIPYLNPDSRQCVFGCVSALFYLIMIMTKPSHSSGVISFYSTILCETDNVLAPRSPQRTTMSRPLGGPQTSGKMRELRGMETMQQRNLHLFVSEQPWSVPLKWQHLFQL